MSQSLSNVLLHLIFHTKNHEPWITSNIEPELFAYICTLCKQEHCPVISINGNIEHIHILCQLSRTKSVAELVELIKKRTSKWIKTKGDYYRNFQWQGGYGVFSIGQSNVYPLKTYIENQKSHHEKKTFREEFLEFLKLYKIEFDEKFL